MVTGFEVEPPPPPEGGTLENTDPLFIKPLND
jgi:hypothetical protein